MFNTGKFVGKTVVITGASRGIGKEIGLKLAKDGANIVIAAKTAEPHPKLPGTIYTAAEEIEKAGGKAYPCIVDVRDEKSVQEAVEGAVKKFGGIDILINNASAISLTNTEDTNMKRYDLMHQINSRGTYLMSRTCLPYLKQGKNPHILNISPPLVMDKQWFENHVAYTMAKYGMSMCVLGMSGEFKSYGIAVNALWPLTGIWTAAMSMLSAGDKSAAAGCRKPDIMADAAYAMLSKNSKDYTGRFEIDEDVLTAEGVRDFSKYAVDPNGQLIPDYFLPDHLYKKFTQSAPGYTETKRVKSREAISKSSSATEVSSIVENVKKVLGADAELRKLQSTYQFDVDGRSLALDIKNGKFEEGKLEKPDVVFTMKSDVFVSLFKGEITAVTAFMTKKIALKGDLTAAMKLEGLMKKVQKSSKA